MNKTDRNRKTTRLQSWDYRWAGSYFITICTQHRTHYFGEVVGGKMQLSPIGAIADVLWYEIKNRANNLELGEFVVMPNHIHGILILNTEGTLPATSQQIHETSQKATSQQKKETVRTFHETSQQSQQIHETSQLKNEEMANISPKSGSISTIIRSYKSAVTKHAHRLGFEFQWQSRFYDHIIRDARAFHNISEYIINNPLKWDEDKFYQNNTNQ